MYFLLSGYLLVWLWITIIVHGIESLLWARQCSKHYKDLVI